MMRALIVLVAFAGCTQYAKTSTHNAPLVTNLDEPPLRETGDPAAFETGTDPGTETLAVFLTPGVILGSGRYGTEIFHAEPTFALRFEHKKDPGRGYLDASAFAITVGTGIVALDTDRPTTPAAVFAMLDYRFIAKVIPMDVGLGPVLYPGADRFSTDIGAQLDFKITILEARFRYMKDTGFEFGVGYSLPIPLFFQRSR